MVSLDRRVARQADGIIVETPQDRAAHLIFVERFQNAVIVRGLIGFGVLPFRSRSAGRQAEFLKHHRLGRLRFVEFNEVGQVSGFVVEMKAPKIKMLVEVGKIFAPLL